MKLLLWFIGIYCVLQYFIYQYNISVLMKRVTECLLYHVESAVSDRVLITSNIRESLLFTWQCLDFRLLTADGALWQTQCGADLQDEEESGSDEELSTNEEQVWWRMKEAAARRFVRCVFSVSLCL